MIIYASILEVLRQLRTIKTDIKQILLNTKKENVETLPEAIPFCPIDNIEELIRFNKNLENEDFFSKACSQFHILGGKDGPEITRKIMTNLITHRIALQMNWSGRNEKPGFSTFEKIIRLIYVCVRKNLFAQDTTLSCIENTIKIWLRNAPDREGGRARRRNIKVFLDN